MRDYIYVADSMVPESCKDGLLLLIDRVRMRRLLWNETPGFYVPVHRDTIREMCGGADAATAVVRDALDSGLLERNDSYCPKKYSKGYRLGPVLRDAKFKRWYPAPGSKLSKRLVKAVTREDEDEGLTLPVHLWLRDAARAVTIDDDFELALLQTDFRDSPRCTHERGRERRDDCFRAIERIKNSPIRCSVNSTGRFYSRITNLHREGRQCLRLGGERIRGVDIKNSHYYLMSLMVLPVLAPCGPGLGFYGERGADLFDWHNITGFLDAWRCVDDSASLEGFPPDFRAFRDDVCEGRFYERLASDSGKPRDYVKLKCMSVMFGNESNGTRIGKSLARLYPSVFGAVDDLKRIHPHELIAQTLQRWESGLVVETACEVLRSRPGGCAVLSWHDALWSGESHLEGVRAVLEGTYAGLPWRPRFE